MATQEIQSSTIETVQPRTLEDIDSEVIKQIGVSSCTFGASAASKINLGHYESFDVWGSFSITFDLSSVQSDEGVIDIVNNVVAPMRNSFIRYAHPEVMACIEEIKAMVEGIRDGDSPAEIAEAARRSRHETLAAIRRAFT